MLHTKNKLLVFNFSLVLDRNILLHVSLYNSFVNCHSGRKIIQINMALSCINSSKKIDHNVCLKRPLIMEVFYWKKDFHVSVTGERNQDSLFSKIQLPAQ